MSVSIVVISKNERALDGTLRALGDVKADVDHEVIVVDASREALDDIRLGHPEVRWIDFAPVPGKRVTIPEQRNVGVRAATGDVVVFTDAGCFPQEEWLPELIAPILAGEETVTCGVTGSANGDHIYDANPLTDDYLYECATINMAFTRAAFDEVGGFDESFDYCSDSDFTWRLNDANHRVRLVRSARVDHDWGNRSRQAKRAWYYGSGRAHLYLQHRTSQRWKRMAAQDPILLAYPLFLLGLPVALRFRSYLLLLAVPLWRSRAHQPFTTLLDHVCYGAGALARVGGLTGVRRP